jgi:hypothetical protein
MTVKNQFVTAFKINGLEVDRKDMPKFEKMINQLVSKKEDEIDQNMWASSDPNFINNYNEQSNAFPGFEAQNIDIQDGEVVSYLGDGKVVMIDEKGTSSELTVDENGGRLLLITKRKGGEPISVSLGEDQKTIFIGGIKSSPSALKSLGWMVTDKGLQPISGFKNIQPLPPVPPLPPIPPSPQFKNKKAMQNHYRALIDHYRALSNQAANQGVKARELGELNGRLSDLEAKLSDKKVNLDEITVELDNIAADIDSKTAEADSENTHSDSYHYNHSDDGDEEADQDNNAPNEIFDKWLEMELVKDGYIKSIKKYDFLWTEKKMIVNGKKVSDTHRLKYVDQHKKITGNSMGKSFTISRNSITD